MTSRPSRPDGYAAFAAWVIAVAMAAATPTPAAPASARPVTPASAVDPFDLCELGVRAQPDLYEPYGCFYTQARASGRWEEAERRLVRLGAELPVDGWTTLLRGHLWLLRDEPRAIDFYRQAAADFTQHGVARGEVVARVNLRNILQRRGDTTAAAAEVARVLAVAERSADPALLAQALVMGAMQQVDTSGDLGRAHRDLRRALSLMPADTAYAQRKFALFALGRVAYQLGRFEEAADAYSKLLELAREQHDDVEEATLLFNIANARQRQLEEQPAPGGAAALEGIVQAALAAARRTANRLIEVRSSAMLAQLEAARGERASARRRLEESLASARQMGHPERILICLWLLADLTAADDPAESQRRNAEAAALALSTDNDRWLAYTWQSRMRVDWQTRPRTEAVETARQALGAIEALAARQPEETAAIGLFGSWARDYRWLAGRLLDAPAPDLDAAFGVMERMRARALLQALASSASRAPAGATAAVGAREGDALQALIAVQRELLAPGGRPDERAALLARLEQRELDLAEARARRGAGPTAGDLHAVSALGELRAGLHPREAVVIFQLAPWRDLYGAFAGGSWAFVVTHDGAAAHRLPDRAAVEPLVPLFLGLLERRDGSEELAARKLWELLLEKPLAGLPADTDTLVIVPDAALFSLPFEVLRPGGADTEPLGVRYEVAIVPSATALLRWRGAAVPPADRSVLILADPELPASATVAATVRGAALGDEVLLGRLPAARREGVEIARLLAPTSELLVGAAATERVLDRTDLSRFAILHFAAHAVADGVHPQRSAVLLAPADVTQDGLLQGREISRLPLAGRTVFLSACRTAAGAVVGGEGPLSLARAFQEAGARAVVASRWPLRDAETAGLVTSVYEEIAAGRRLGAALRVARRRAWQEGLPSAAWAGLVLMGEPDTAVLAGVPVDERSLFRSAKLWWAVVLAAAVAALVAAALRRR